MTSKTKHSCPNCGGPVLKVRWDSGYHYCKERVCFLALGKKVSTYEHLPIPGETDLDVGDTNDQDGLYDD